MGKKVYISGPITGTDDYMERFARKEAELTEEGCIVINPAKVNRMLPDETGYGEYMMMCLEMMRMCDSVCMMDGWERSNGARFEHMFAKITGKDIVYESRRDEGERSEGRGRDHGR